MHKFDKTDALQANIHAGCRAAQFSSFRCKSESSVFFQSIKRHWIPCQARNDRE
ncbi:MAG: hypothetical protein ABL880_09215 [Methylotenera sp.]